MPLMFYDDTNPSPFGAQDLLNAALATSVRTFQDGGGDLGAVGLSEPRDHCPLWQPSPGLVGLDQYATVGRCEPSTLLPESSSSSNSPCRWAIFHRLVDLCLALWGVHPQQETEEALMDVSMDHDDAMDSSFPSAGCPAKKKAARETPMRDSVQSAAVQSLAVKQAVSEWIRCVTAGCSITNQPSDMSIICRAEMMVISYRLNVHACSRRIYVLS